VSVEGPGRRAIVACDEAVVWSRCSRPSSWPQRRAAAWGGIVTDRVARRVAHHVSRRLRTASTPVIGVPGSRLRRPAILLPDGIGEVRFGEATTDALPWFEERFGPPDDVRSAHDPDLWGYLSDGPDVEGRIRIVTWGQLWVVFLDRSGTVAPDALPFAAWALGWGEGDGPALMTPEAIGLGSTLADLERAYGDALTVPEEPGGACGISWVFTVDATSGPYRGTFEEEPRTSDAEVAAIGAGVEPSC